MSDLTQTKLRPPRWVEGVWLVQAAVIMCVSMFWSNGVRPSATGAATFFIVLAIYTRLVRKLN